MALGRLIPVGRLTARTSTGATVTVGDNTLLSLPYSGGTQPAQLDDTLSAYPPTTVTAGARAAYMLRIAADAEPDGTGTVRGPVTVYVTSSGHWHPVNISSQLTTRTPAQAEEEDMRVVADGSV